MGASRPVVVFRGIGVTLPKAHACARQRNSNPVVGQPSEAATFELGNGVGAMGYRTVVEAAT